MFSDQKKQHGLWKVISDKTTMGVNHWYSLELIIQQERVKEVDWLNYINVISYRIRHWNSFCMKIHHV